MVCSIDQYLIYIYICIVSKLGICTVSICSSNPLCLFFYMNVIVYIKTMKICVASLLSITITIILILWFTYVNVSLSYITIIYHYYISLLYYKSTLDIIKLLWLTTMAVHRWRRGRGVLGLRGTAGRQRLPWLQACHGGRLRLGKSWENDGKMPL